MQPMSCRLLVRRRFVSLRPQPAAPVPVPAPAPALATQAREIAALREELVRTAAERAQLGAERDRLVAELIRLEADARTLATIKLAVFLTGSIAALPTAVYLLLVR